MEDSAVSNDSGLGSAMPARAGYMYVGAAGAHAYMPEHIDYANPPLPTVASVPISARQAVRIHGWLSPSRYMPHPGGFMLGPLD